MKCDLSLIAIVRVLLKNIHEKKGVVAKLLDTLSKIIRLLFSKNERALVTYTDKRGFNNPSC